MRRAEHERAPRVDGLACPCYVDPCAAPRYLPSFVAGDSKMGDGGAHVARVQATARQTAATALDAVRQHFTTEDPRHKRIAAAGRKPFAQVQAALIRAAGVPREQRGTALAEVIVLLRKLTKAGDSEMRAIVPGTAARRVEVSTAVSSSAVMGPSDLAAGDAMTFEDVTLLRFAAHFVLFVRATLEPGEDEAMGADGGGDDDYSNVFAGGVAATPGVVNHQQYGNDIIHLYSLHLMRHHMVRGFVRTCACRTTRG